MCLTMWVGSEWAVNIQRDSYASYIGHTPLLSFFAIAENESIGRVRYNFMQVSVVQKENILYSQVKRFILDVCVEGSLIVA